MQRISSCATYRGEDNNHADEDEYRLSIDMVLLIREYVDEVVLDVCTCTRDSIG